MQTVESIQVLMDQGRFDLAESALRSQLAKHPEDAWLLTHFALCFYQTGRLDSALSVCEASIQRDPDYAHAHFVRGVVLEGLAESQPPAEKSFRLTWYPPPHPLAIVAGESFEEAIRLDPLEPLYRQGRSANWLAQRRLSEARDSAERGLALSPGHSGLLNLLANIFREQGMLSEAYDASVRALANDPDDASTHANQGWTMLRRGQDQDAFQHFRESLRLYPDSVWARRGMQEALKRRFKPYGWSAGVLHWLCHYDPRGQVRNGWVMAGLLVGLLLGGGGLSYFMLSINQGSIGGGRLAAGGFLALVAGLVGAAVFIGISLLARSATELAAVVLIFSADGRRTLSHDEKHRWLAVTLMAGWCVLVFLAFAFLPKTSQAPFAVLTFGGIGVLLALAWGLDQLRSRGIWFWLGFAIAVVSSGLVVAGADRAGDSPGWVSFGFLGALGGAMVMYIFLEDPEPVRSENGS